MNTKLVGALAFTIGAAIGSLVTWKLAKDKYEQLAQEDAESFRKVLSKYTDKLEVTEVEPEEEEHTSERPHIPEKPSLAEYVEHVKEYGYSSNTNYSDISKNSNDETEGKGGVKSMDKDCPYIIPPDDYGALDGYECVSLNYYADKVLADDWDNVIDNVDDIVGEDNLERFAEYDEDSIYVRNDKLMTDYEILPDSRTFASISNHAPYRVDD